MRGKVKYWGRKLEVNGDNVHDKDKSKKSRAE